MARPLIPSVDVALPASLVTFWSYSGHPSLESLDATILGPADAHELITLTPWKSIFEERGLIPILDDQQSNYLALAVREPLAFRVLYVPHDDGTRLLYRNLDNCLRGLKRLAASGESADLGLRKIPGDHPPDAPRPIEDQNAAKAILASKEETDDWVLAVQLLDESNVSEWPKLLESGMFVRRDAVKRMKRMHSDEIKNLLKKDGGEFEHFADAVSAALRDEGIQVGIRQETTMNVGGSWYDLNVFFPRRHIPQAMERLVLWIKDQLAKRDPRIRPNNFMSDDSK